MTMVGMDKSDARMPLHLVLCGVSVQVMKVCFFGSFF